MATFMTQDEPQDELQKLQPMGAPTPYGSTTNDTTNPFSALEGGTTSGTTGSTTTSTTNPFSAFEGGTTAGSGTTGSTTTSTSNPFSALEGGTTSSAQSAPAPAPTTAPTTAAPAPATAAPAPASMDPAAAVTQLQQQFQQQFGRAMTPEEQTTLQQNLGYTAGMAITPELMQRASGLIAGYSGSLPGAAPAAAAAPAPTPAQTTDDMAQAQLQQLLMSGSTPAMSEVDMNNPALVAQRVAFDRSNGRVNTQARLAAAERNAARGTLGAGGFDAELAGVERDSADRATGFESQLLKGELQGQRDRVMKAMEMAVNSGNAAQARALQERLGQLDASLRREGMADQKMLGKGQLSLGLLQSLLGNQRAQDALGFNYAQLGVNANQGAMQALLNGLGGS